MNEHSFGGNWTLQKLDILKRYLGFYVQALKDTRYKLIYIDAFAGSGRCNIKVRGSAKLIPGSANIALDTKPSFKELFFIEKKAKHAKQLNELLLTHAHGSAAKILQGDAERLLQGVLDSQNWSNTRGVLFLDPYGLQCDWDMVQAIAKTQALDVFFLVSLSGIYRQATNNLRDADSDKREALSRFLGTSGWQTALYANQQDMFGPDDQIRSANVAGLVAYMRDRLDSIFAKVMEPKILYQQDKNGTQGAPLYALFFAVSNPAKSAITLASKVSKEIMSKLQ
jgi:three-Cys-motif partner protein